LRMCAAVMAVTQMCKHCGRVFGSYLCDNPLYFYFPWFKLYK